MRLFGRVVIVAVACAGSGLIGIDASLASPADGAQFSAHGASARPRVA